MLPHNRETVVCVKDGETRINSLGKKVILTFSSYSGTTEDPLCEDVLYELFWLGDDGFCYDSYGVAHHGFQTPTPDFKLFPHLI